MPAESEAQRGFLNWKFGHKWVKKHHFANKGKLPEYKHKGHKMNDQSKLIRLSQIDDNLDSLVRFEEEENPYKKVAVKGLEGGGLVGAGYLGHRAIQEAGGYKASLAAGEAAFKRGARGTALHGVRRGPGRFIGHQAGRAYGALSRAFPGVVKALSDRERLMQFQGIPAMGEALAQKAPSWLWTIGKRALGTGLVGAGLGAAGGAATGYVSGTGAGQGALRGAALGGVTGAAAGGAGTALSPALSRWASKSKALEGIEPGLGQSVSAGMDPLLRKWGYQGGLGSQPASTGMGSKDKLVRFDEDQAQLPAKRVEPILEPMGEVPQTKNIQEEFPAGKSPFYGPGRDPTAEVLRLPFPELMRLLKNKEILRQQYSGFSKLGKLVELDQKMDQLIHFKSGIHINPKNKGKFDKTKEETGESTEELEHSKNPKTRKRAVFAENAKKWKH